MRTMGGGSRHGAEAFFVASSGKGIETGGGAVAGGGSCALPARAGNAKGAIKREIFASERKRSVRRPTIRPQQYYFCTSGQHMHFGERAVSIKRFLQGRQR